MKLCSAKGTNIITKINENIDAIPPMIPTKSKIFQTSLLILFVFGMTVD